MCNVQIFLGKMIHMYILQIHMQCFIYFIFATHMEAITVFFTSEAKEDTSIHLGKQIGGNIILCCMLGYTASAVKNLYIYMLGY